MDSMITVVIPTFNGERYIERAVRSVLNQPNHDLIDIIIVNDGSTDGTASVCDSIAAENKNVMVIHKKNGGVSAARNIGIDIAQGKYIAFLDCDDFWGKNVITERIIEKMRSGDACDIYQFAYREVDSTGKLEKVYGIKDRYHSFSHPGFGRYDWSHPCSFIYKAELLRKYGIVFPNVKYGEDIPFPEECLYWATSFEQINTVLLSYVENFTGLVHRTPLIYALSESFKAVYSEQAFFKSYGVAYDAEASVVWKCASNLPKCCALHSANEVKDFMNMYCFEILKTRKDIRFGEELWDRLVQFSKHPILTWLKYRIVVGFPLHFRNSLYKIPGIMGIAHNFYNRWHRKMNYVSKDELENVAY